MEIRRGINGGKLIAGQDGTIRGTEVKAADQNKKHRVIMRSLQKLFPLEMKENDIRPFPNPRMKKTNEKNDDLSKQIKEDEEKKENNYVKNDELSSRSSKNLKQSDMEHLNHGDAYVSVDYQSVQKQLMLTGENISRKNKIY